jgi:hypothetical protein
MQKLLSSFSCFLLWARCLVCWWRRYKIFFCCPDVVKRSETVWKSKRFTSHQSVSGPKPSRIVGDPELCFHTPSRRNNFLGNTLIKTSEQTQDWHQVSSCPVPYATQATTPLVSIPLVETSIWRIGKTTVRGNAWSERFINIRKGTESMKQKYILLTSNIQKRLLSIRTQRERKTCLHFFFPCSIMSPIHSLGTSFVVFRSKTVP